MDREQIGPAALGEFKGEPFIALRAASQPPRPEQQATAGIRIQTPDRADHRLLERREQKPLAGKTSRRRLDDLRFIPGLLDLDIETDAAGAEIEDRVQLGRLDRLRRTRPG